MTTIEAATACGLSKEGFLKAARKLNIQPVTVGPVYTWTDEQVKQVRERVSVERPSRFPTKEKE